MMVTCLRWPPLYLVVQASTYHRRCGTGGQESPCHVRVVRATISQHCVSQISQKMCRKPICASCLVHLAVSQGCTLDAIGRPASARALHSSASKRERSRNGQWRKCT